MPDQGKPSPNPPNASSPAPQRQPWPMWPLGLAIVLFAVLYTFVNIKYRKEGRAYEPFQVIMDRINAPVEKNFYDWYGLKSTRSPDESPFSSPAQVAAVPATDPLETVLPEQVKFFLASKPILAPMPGLPESPDSIVQGEPLRLRLWLPAALGDDVRFKLLAFYKEGQLFLMPTLFVGAIEDAADALLGEPRPFAFEIPTSPFESPTISVQLLVDHQVAQWTIAATPAAATPATAP